MRVIGTIIVVLSSSSQKAFDFSTFARRMGLLKTSRSSHLNALAIARRVSELDGSPFSTLWIVRSFNLVISAKVDWLHPCSFRLFLTISANSASVSRRGASKISSGSTVRGSPWVAGGSMQPIEAVEHDRSPTASPTLAALRNQHRAVAII